MHTPGHVGAALLTYLPVAGVVAWAGLPRFAVLGICVGAAVSTLPDADQLLPIDHRGGTHTVWFVFGVAAIAGAAGWALGAALGDPPSVSAVVGTAVGLSLLSHLLVDSITPMGIRPFAPVSEFHHSFDIVRSANHRANAALFSAGLAAVGFWYLVIF